MSIFNVKKILHWKELPENDKIVLKNMIGAFSIKGLSLVISLFTMPSYIRYFNNEVVLGLWFTILSILNWLLNFDFGVGNGLRNHLSATLAVKNDVESKKYISSAYFAIAALCVGITGIFFLVCEHVNWNAVFNIEVNSLSNQALLTSVKIVFLGIMVQLFLRLISSVLYAMQKSSVNNFMTLCTSILTVITIRIIPPRDNEYNMICMAIVHAFAVAIPLLCATMFVFLKSDLRRMRPSLSFFSIDHARKVLSLGGTFFVVQLVYMVIMNTNDYFITSLTGSEYVVNYQIYYRLFTLGSMVFSLAMTPIWSAVTKAAAEKNIQWINGLYKKLVKLSVIGFVCELIVIPFLQIFVNFWLGDDAIIMSAPYGVVFAFMGGAMIFNGALSSIANGLGRLRNQAIWFSVGAILKYPLAWILVKCTGTWIGVPFATALVLTLYCIAEIISLNRSFKQPLV